MGASSIMIFACLILTVIILALNLYNYIEECIVDEGSKWLAVTFSIGSLIAIVAAWYLYGTRFYLNHRTWSLGIGGLCLFSVAIHLYINIDQLESSRGKTFGIITNSIGSALILIITGLSMKWAGAPVDTLSKEIGRCNKLKNKLDKMKRSLSDAGLLNEKVQGSGRSITVSLNE